MTNEDTFIKKLEVYLDTVFDKYSRNRILVMLKEYREEIPSVMVKGDERVVEVFIPVVPTSGYKSLSDENLMRLASEMCLINKISLNEFMHTPKGSYCKHNIVDARKEFCRKIKIEHKVSNQQLKNFFGVDHTTITYYIKGKKSPYIPQKKTA